MTVSIAFGISGSYSVVDDDVVVRAIMNMRKEEECLQPRIEVDYVLALFFAISRKS